MTIDLSDEETRIVYESVDFTYETAQSLLVAWAGINSLEPDGGTEKRIKGLMARRRVLRQLMVKLSLLLPKTNTGLNSSVLKNVTPVARDLVQKGKRRAIFNKIRVLERRLVLVKSNVKVYSNLHQTNLEHSLPHLEADIHYYKAALSRIDEIEAKKSNAKGVALPKG